MLKSRTAPRSAAPKAETWRAIGTQAAAVAFRGNVVSKAKSPEDKERKEGVT